VYNDEFEGDNEQIAETGQAAAAAVTTAAPTVSAVAPVLLVATVVATQPPAVWLLLIKSYAVVATLPLIAITLYLSSGHSVARVQRWREQSKGFLQWTSGIALVLLTVYLTVLQVGVGV
jgi:cytochrome c biogenesis protein CcdA